MAFAASQREVKEFGMDVVNPNLISSKESVGNFSQLASEIIDGEKVSLEGGTLWAQFQGATHRGNYEHASKEHRTSATNSNGVNKQSLWRPAGIRAVSDWCPSTIMGNKVWGAIR